MDAPAVASADTQAKIMSFLDLNVEDGFSGSKAIRGKYAAPPEAATWGELGQLAAGLACLYCLDKALYATFTVSLGWHFPSALVGMFGIVGVLLAAARGHKNTAAAATAYFRPAVEWVAHKWLPVFYAPALVTLPLAVQPLAGKPALAARGRVCSPGVGRAGAAGLTLHTSLRG
jgi:hypothetical protein